MKTVVTESPAETRHLAAGMASRLVPPAVILLEGDLGAGKTCFVQGLAEGLGWTGAVNSPTYALVREYDCRPGLVHADLYRLTDPEGVFDLELEEVLEAPVILAVEWSERAGDFWPEHAVRVALEPVEGYPNRRRIHISGGGEDG